MQYNTDHSDTNKKYKLLIAKNGSRDCNMEQSVNGNVSNAKEMIRARKKIKKKLKLLNIRSRPILKKNIW